jgi:hypothetical protein
MLTLVEALFARAHPLARRASAKENLAAVHEERQPALLILEITNCADCDLPLPCEFLARQNIVV